MTKTMNYDEKIVLKRITDYGPKPKSGVSALQQAHAFLCEEGVWIQNWFADGDPEEAFEKGMCSNVRACSMSAIGFVSGEAPVRILVEHHPEGSDYWFDVFEEYSEISTPVSAKAAMRLASTINKEAIECADDAFETVISENDGERASRTSVLDNFAAAIRAAGREPLIDHTRSTISIKRQLASLKRSVKS